MASLLYDVLYTTNQSQDQIERLLRARCAGAWQVEPESGSDEEVHRYRVVFERETDIRTLCRPWASA